MSQSTWMCECCIPLMPKVRKHVRKHTTAHNFLYSLLAEHWPLPAFHLSWNISSSTFCVFFLYKYFASYAYHAFPSMVYHENELSVLKNQMNIICEDFFVLIAFVTNIYLSSFFFSFGEHLSKWAFAKLSIW